MNENQIEANLGSIFEQALHQQPSFVPEDLPMEWVVGQHKYIRVLAGEDTLDEKLKEFRDLGVKVLDFDRRWGFWVFKTMAPS